MIFFFVLKKSVFLKTSFSTAFQIRTDPAYADIVCKLHDFNNTVYSITVLVFLTNELLSVDGWKADQEMQRKDSVPL